VHDAAADLAPEIEERQAMISFRRCKEMLCSRMSASMGTGHSILLERPSRETLDRPRWLAALRWIAPLGGFPSEHRRYSVSGITSRGERNRYSLE
jgi:hypothetical protein